MELKEFIESVLIQISEGVKDSAPKLNKRGVKVMHKPSLQYEDYNTRVSFDVSVLTSEKNNSEGKAGIFVGSTGLGGKKGSTNESYSESRIKFDLFIHINGQDGK